MMDLQQRRSRKRRKLTEIKRELSNSEENEGDFVNSMTSPNHFNSQIVIKQEESPTSEAEEDSVHLNKITSLTCQVKTEPGSEEGCELENTAGYYPESHVVKREIIEVHKEDQHIMDNEGDHKKTTKDEDSGTETNPSTKSENEMNWSPNLPENNTEKQKNMFDQNKQQNCGRIGEETEISHTQAKTRTDHKCSVCTKTFHSRQACLQHMWNTHTGENPYTCEVCGKGFKYLSKLQVHKTVHSDERPFSCDLCDKVFKCKGDLQRHKVFHHSDERPYSCDLCKQTFKHKNNLNIHKTTVHSDIRRYSCDVCNKAFKRKQDLQKHKMQCHSNERPYSCDLCKKMFKLKDVLYTHTTTVHSDERPYSCDVCNKAFKRKQNLQKHKIQCHSNQRPYSCDLCKKSFKQKENLNTHITRVHSDERPYSCDMCDKAFKQKFVLQNHKMQCHSNEKPYSCDV